MIQHLSFPISVAIGQIVTSVSTDTINHCCCKAMWDNPRELGQSGKTHKGEGTALLLLQPRLSASTTERSVTGRA